MSDEMRANEMKDEVIHKLTVLQTTDDASQEEVVDDAKKKIEEIFNDLQDWLKDNMDPEAVKAALEKARQDSKDVLNRTKDRLVEIGNSEQFQSTMEAGKEFIQGTGEMIIDGVKAGTDALMRNDTIKKIVDHADSKLDVLRESEGLKKTVEAAEEVTEKVNKAVFDGIKSFLNKKNGE